VPVNAADDFATLFLQTSPPWSAASRISHLDLL
jgi:hypothetical protein